ncbi:Dead-box atp-dependent rna helicase [Thalictrum thalictroides]|uniref:ATP-dependent RNA helicase n=1 Tax=Thalictrum thalictroides TaxID=46969 RepID=A0A7J6WUM4_THATH|nr:Dead-box atp-dependent rna helicase [Thalictrum thalictroides]
MPGQILPLRMLSSSVSFSTMKLSSSIQSSSRGISVFSKVFPFKCKYLGLGRNGLLNGFGARNFSSGSSPASLRSRIGSSRSNGGGRSSELSRSRGGERGGFQGGSFGGRIGQAKSLIEEEDEVDDWISELKPDSFRLEGTSGSDDDSGRDRFRDSGRGRDSGSMRSQRGGRGGFSSSKRSRESDSDDFDLSDRRSSRGGAARGSRGSMTSSRNAGGGSDSDMSYGRTQGGGRGGRDSEMSYGRSRGGGRGGRDSDMRYGSSRGGGRDSDTSYGTSRGGGRGGRDSDMSYSRTRGGGRGGTDSDMSYGRTRGGGRGGRDSDMSYDRTRGSGRGGRDSDLSYSRSRGDAVSSPVRRGGRDSDLSYGHSRGGGIIQKGRKQPSLMSDKDGEDDDDDDSDSSFGDLLSEDDSDEDEDDDELPSKRRGQELKGAVSSAAKRKRKDSDLSYDQLQVGGSLLGGRKQALQISDDDDDTKNEKAIPTFGDFLSEEDSEEDDVSDLKPMGGSALKDKTHPVPDISNEKAESYLSEARFDQCAISSLSMKGIKDAGYEKMTVVQEATLPVILKGKDVLAKARTGTGKTVAFLLPAIEAIVKLAPVDRDQKRPPINVLVVCPTRELASQAAAEAAKLLKYHSSIGVQIVIGGVRLALEQKRLQANPCQILVATPGRLKDHIENTAGFATRLMGVKVLVLDEADHLLDMGFRKDIEKIIAAVPKQRQTLLFSATVPEDVRQICHIALKRDHEFINTVEEGSEETHALVRQMHLVAPLDKQFSLLYALLKDHIADDVDYKVLVFCTTAMVTRLVADLLSELKMNVREIHSRKPQSYRTRISDEFRKSKGLILVTSDVSARGVDYPDVTLVIQVGLPSGREQYIHRLGRTGRKGKEGQGILMLAPWEDSFLSSVKDLPITKAEVPSVDPDTKKKVERALSNVEMKNKEAAYQAWLGYYNSSKIGKDKVHLVELANDFSRSMGLDNPPAIPKLILGKMGLRNVPGLRTK